MAIRDVLRIGDARLLQQARPVVDFDTPALHGLIADMFDTMAACNGAGLAAPQIGVDLRVVVFGLTANARYPQAAPIPRTVLINPVIAVVDSSLESAWEGCLSVPGMRGLVPRPVQIRYRARDPWGAEIEQLVSGFHARVVQHECDHLDGILYPSRITDMTRFGFIEELAASGAFETGQLPCEDER